MVHAQITCKSVELRDHSPTNDAYLSRPTLSAAYAGDVYAAMCCFGICGTNGEAASLQAAAAEIPEISQVQRKVIHNCTVVYDSDRSALLYDPSDSAGVVAHVTEDGVVTTKYTNSGAHIMETDPAIADSNQRMQTAEELYQRLWCQPQDRAPGGVVLDPPAGNNSDNVAYIVDQGHVSLPVLVYNGTVCVDYTSGTVVGGISSNNGGVNDTTTRDLYGFIGTEDMFSNADSVQDNRAPHYVRRVGFEGKEYMTEYHKLLTSAQRLDEWLGCIYQQQHNNLGYGDGNVVTNGNAAVPFVGLNRNDDYIYRASNVQAAAPQIDRTDVSMLGGPLPLMIVTEGRLAGTVRVAPLNVDGGLTHVARVQHNGAVDTDMLAARMSRTGGRNVIGVAMQKIAPNAQGDIMLHDGV